MKVLRSRFRAWLDEESAYALREGIKSRLDEAYKERGDAFEFGKAQEIQEKRAYLIGIEAVLQDILALLNFEEEALVDYLGEELIDDEQRTDREHEWDISSSGQDTD